MALTSLSLSRLTMPPSPILALVKSALMVPEQSFLKDFLPTLSRDWPTAFLAIASKRSLSRSVKGAILGPVARCAIGWAFFAALVVPQEAAKIHSMMAVIYSIP